MSTVTVSETGQVLIPQALRTARNWSQGTRLELEEWPQGLLLRPVDSALFPPTTLDALMGITRYNGPALTDVEIQAALDAQAKSEGSPF